jgi:acyl-coenzyme A thioesterase PaaI-like protein
VRKGGKRLVIVEAEVAQEDEDDGEIVALATGTYTRVGG